MEPFGTKLFLSDRSVGHIVVYPMKLVEYCKSNFGISMKIDHLSAQSERIPPLVTLHIIGETGLILKLAANGEKPNGWNQLISMHKTCILEKKTAVVVLGNNRELHLVPMTSKARHEQQPCFWAYLCQSGLYDSCLNLLNPRCLAIVFDLDETLLVANTEKSFADKIDALERRIAVEADPGKRSMMAAESLRHKEDYDLLRQYRNSDEILTSEGILVAQPEPVAPVSREAPRFERPVIRCQEKNIVLTRIDPLNRDTSVLVRFRTAWEELKDYIVAAGRKRFEPFVCTMSEKEYALEMWRLLDPHASLIPSIELYDRVVAVKPDSRKSLASVFHKNQCHPRMAFVVDDRLKVWEDADQLRVHVVPPFLPYYDPHTEARFELPVLENVKNVACNIRGSYFRDMDEALTKQLLEVSYDAPPESLPPFPDVAKYVQMPMPPFVDPRPPAPGALPEKVPPIHTGAPGAPSERKASPGDRRPAAASEKAAG
eukprot:jgi/Mesen1/5014/ME000025S04417